MKQAKKQYTLRQVPPEVDSALRLKARKSGKSLNTVLLEAVGASVSAREKHADLDSFFGSWVADRETDRALEEQRRVDEGLWR